MLALVRHGRLPERFAATRFFHPHVHAFRAHGILGEVTQCAELRIQPVQATYAVRARAVRGSRGGSHVQQVAQHARHLARVVASPEPSRPASRWVEMVRTSSHSAQLGLDRPVESPLIRTFMASRDHEWSTEPWWPPSESHRSRHRWRPPARPAPGLFGLNAGIGLGPIDVDISHLPAPSVTTGPPSHASRAMRADASSQLSTTSRQSVVKNAS